MKWIIQYFDEDAETWMDCDEIPPCVSKEEALSEMKDWRSKQCGRVKTRVATF